MRKIRFKSHFRYLVHIKYLIPNLFTCLSVYFAYLAFDSPDVVDRCWYLLLCVVMDKLDGTSARLLKATSKFGLKFDSLADAIAFGILPGVIVYEGASLPGVVHPWTYVFKASGILYIVATFARLYKFDRMASGDESPDNFFGIPSTLAAAVFAAYCVAFGDQFPTNTWLVFLLPLLAVLLSILMNGNFPTLKVGIPQRKFLLFLQILGFAYVFVAIPLRKTGPGLFTLAVVVLFVTIYGGRKKYGRPKSRKKQESSVEEPMEVTE